MRTLFIIKNTTLVIRVQSSHFIATTTNKICFFFYRDLFYFYNKIIFNLLMNFLCFFCSYMKKNIQIWGKFNF